MSDNEIDELISDDEINDDNTENQPTIQHFPTIDVIVGSCKSGKSNLAKYIIADRLRTNPNLMFAMFNNGAVPHEGISDKYVYGWDIDKFEELANIDGDKIILLEDLMSQVQSERDKKRLVNILSIHRHLRLSVVIITQTIISLPSALRMRELSSDMTMYVFRQTRLDRLKTVFEACECWEVFDELIAINKALDKYEWIKINADNTFIVDKCIDMSELIINDK